MTAGKHKAKNNILSTTSPGTQFHSTDEINARVLWFYWGSVGVFLRQARSPTARYWMSSSVRTDYDNEETASHCSPVATPSNIHQCWLNSRQLPIGRVSHLYPATFVHSRMENRDLSHLQNNKSASCYDTWMYVHETDTPISLSIYLLTYLVGFKWTFIFTAKEVCACVCVGGGVGVVTVRHLKYFMSCWTREERVPRKVDSTYLTNLGWDARATHPLTHSHVHTLRHVHANKGKWILE